MNVEKIADLAAMEIVGGQPTPEALDRELERVREIVARYVRPEWEPIETAPKDGTFFLAWDGRHCGVVCWDDDLAATAAPTQWALYNSFAIDAMEATHWQPLPTPPDTPSSPERDQ